MSSPAPTLPSITKAYRVLSSRPRLLMAIAIGLATGAALTWLPTGLRPSTAAILAWDTGCASFIVSILWRMLVSDVHGIRRHAQAQDEGRGFILGLVLVAAAASLMAIGVELSLAKEAHGLERAARVALAFTTVGVSWFTVQLIFALHYAHEYYDRPGLEPGGLLFPGDEAPDYWDFVHFAVVVGVAGQTADVAFCSKALRRVGTVHCVIAFTFNTVLLALTINLLAGLF